MQLDLFATDSSKNHHLKNIFNRDLNNELKSEIIEKVNVDLIYAFKIISVNCAMYCYTMV